MRGNLNQALTAVDLTYNSLVEIADQYVATKTAEIDEIIKEAKDNIQNMSNEYIRNLMLNLSLHSFSFSEIKEKSSLMSACSEIIRKEAYAKAFSTADGSVAAKENTATLNIADEILAETVYELISSLLKTKLDEIHRVVDVLKTILMSRLSEAKLNAVSDAME